MRFWYGAEQVNIDTKTQYLGCANLELMRTTADVNKHRPVDGQQRLGAIEEFGLPHARNPVSNLILGIPSDLIKLLAIFRSSVWAICSGLLITYESKNIVSRVRERRFKIK